MKFVLGMILGALIATVYWKFAGENHASGRATDNQQSLTSAEKLHKSGLSSGSDRSDFDKAKIQKEHASSNKSNQSVGENAEPAEIGIADVGGAASTAADTIKSNPIQNSYEHDKLMNQAAQRKPLAHFHEKLEQEEIDLNWAPELESQIAQFLTKHDLIDAFSVNHITCRTSMCEIEAFGFEGHEKWGTIMRQMQTNDWFHQFQGTSTAASAGSGQATVISILHRNTGDGAFN